MPSLPCIVFLVLMISLISLDEASVLSRPRRLPRPFIRNKESLGNMSKSSLATYLASEASSASSRHRVAVTPSMNFNTDPLQPRGLGAGVSTVSSAPDLVSGVFDSSTLSRAVSDYPLMTQRVTKIETEEDKMNSMTTAATVSGGGYGVTVTASATISKKTETKKTKLTYTLDYLETYKEANLNTQYLVMSSDALLLLNTDVSAFFQKYGRYFYSSYRTGCYLSANVQIETESESSMQELTAELDVAFKAGLFTVHATTTFHDIVTSFDSDVTITGSYDVVGVSIANTTSIQSPADVLAIKAEVAEKCAALHASGAGEVISATYSSYLSVPHVIEQISSKQSLLEMATGTISDEESSLYWNLRNQYDTLEETTKKCAQDPKTCFAQDFFYDSTNLNATSRALYNNVSKDNSELKELNSTTISQHPEILQHYQSNLFLYANEYTEMFETFSEINVNSVQMIVKDRSSSSIVAETPAVQGNTIRTTDAPSSINQTFHSFNGEILAITNINYLVDYVTNKPYIVASSRCFNGGFAQACYNLEDVTAATQQNGGMLILDEKKTSPVTIDGISVPSCSYSENGIDYDYTVQISLSNPYPNGDPGPGSIYGQPCPNPDVTFQYLTDIWFKEIYGIPCNNLDVLMKDTWCHSHILLEKQTVIDNMYGPNLYNISRIYRESSKNGGENCMAHGGRPCIFHATSDTGQYYSSCTFMSQNPGFLFPPNWEVPKDSLRT